MNLSRERLTFYGYTIALLAAGQFAVGHFGVAPDWSYIGGFAVGTLAHEPVLAWLKRRELSRREPDEDARHADGGDA